MGRSRYTTTEEQDQSEHLVRKFYSAAEQRAHTTDSPNLINFSEAKHCESQAKPLNPHPEVFAYPVVSISP